MAIDSKNLLVALKAYAPSNPLPLDARELYDSLEAAQKYTKAANAYAGQTIKVLQNGKYETYVLNGEIGALTLDKVGVDASMVKNYVQVVTELPVDKEQGVIYVNTTDNKGYIYTGTEDKVIFEDVSGLKEQVNQIETNLEGYASLDGATFTGTVTLAADPSGDLEAVTKQYVDRLISGINDFTVGIVDSSNPLPTSDYSVGETFRVAEAGTYAGQECEIGDLIIVIKDFETEVSNNDFLVVQTNIDGAVTGPDASTDATLVIFDGITGKKIKDSAVTIVSVQDAIAKAHEHTNKEILDSFTSTQTEIETAYKAYTDNAVLNLVDNDTLSTTLEGYYTKTDVDDLLNPITTNLNTKLDANAVDAKILEATGDLSGVTVKEYVDTAVGSGGADVAEQILQAKNEAIQTSNTYTDNALTITEF